MQGAGLNGRSGRLARRQEDTRRRPGRGPRAGAGAAQGEPVPGRAREGRWPREPDARAWCRWRRGQSRLRTLIFDLATGRCFPARCPSGPSPSPGSGVSRSGPRGDELLSAPPGSPALLLPPPVLLPPSLRQSSGGSWSRRPRPTAERGPHPDTQTRGVRPGRPRQFDLRAVPPPPPLPGPGHLAKWATPRGWASEPPTWAPEQARGPAGEASALRSQFPCPRGTEGHARLGTPRAKFLLPGTLMGGPDLEPPGPGEVDPSLCNPTRTWD